MLPGIASVIWTFVACPAPTLLTVIEYRIACPGCAAERSADLTSWSCGGGGGAVTLTATLLLETPFGISALTTWATLLIGPKLPAPAWTWARKLTILFPLAPIVPRFQTTDAPCSTPLNASINVVPGGTGSES